MCAFDRRMPGPELLARLGIRIGTLAPGPTGYITDVGGVRVGQVSVVRGEAGRPDAVRTGVTAILPHGGNLFVERVRAAVHVVNGFGKSVGLPQVTELGELETPILLTGTLNVWRAADALVDWMASRNPGVVSFNPVVLECNDGYLSSALQRPVGREEVFQALDSAQSGPVGEGCVGAGTGMAGFGYKAGVGTASRRVVVEGAPYVLGALVLTNTGAPGELRIDGMRVSDGRSDPDLSMGSIIMVLAVDAPLSSRQLGRLARRAAFGLARAGGIAAHGSGDFVLAFSTQRRGQGVGSFPEERLTLFFQAAVETTEEAIVRSILKAETTMGRDGHTREAISLEAVAKAMRRPGGGQRASR
ncbi:MAG: P1 family peptidase [Armatimonadota bacterium]|nr:P1 family peptidase [Armatimonadota bacterium]